MQMSRGLTSILKMEKLAVMKQNKMIFGVHPLLEALESGREIDKIFVRRGLRSDEIQRIMTIARERIIPVQSVPVEKLDRLTQRNHQGVIAFLAEVEYTNLEQLIPMIYEEGRAPFVILLDGLTDVRNFGAIARSAECAGADAIIIPERGSVSVTGDAIKTSAGALLRIPVCRVSSIPWAIRLLQGNGIRIATASERGREIYTETNLSKPIALVMGSEETGPSDESLRLSDSIVRIPQVGSIGSLNVSVAAGILMYEVLRQEQATL